MIEPIPTVLRIDPRPPGGLKAMAAEVYAYYGLDTSELLSTSRSRRVTHPRHAFMWHARQVKWPDGENRYSLPMIGAFLGMDHTSVLHGERAHARRLAEVIPVHKPLRANGLKIAPGAAPRELSDVLSETAPLPSMLEIGALVAERNGMTLEDLRGSSRQRELAYARHEAFALTYATGRFSTTTIGQFYGDRDHTTVMWGIRAHEDRSAGRAYSRRRHGQEQGRAA
jgi:chromosomal replication initiation ATPase DnaA